MSDTTIRDDAAVRPVTAQKPLYGSDRLAEMLRELGYKYAFINPGSSFRGLHDSVVNHLGNTSPEFILTTHENIAIGMAHGYSKAARQPSLAVLHNLVGLMNGSMAIYNAFCDQVPMLILGGSGPADPAQRRFIDWAHTANAQGDLVRPFVKWTDEPATLDAIVDSVLYARKKGLTAPMGPTYISVDAAIQEEPIEAIDLPDLEAPGFDPVAPLAPDADLVRVVADAIMAAKMPLIFGGRFGLDPRTTAPLKRLIELSGSAYKDDRNIVCMPTGHPQNLNGDNAILGEADLIICFDCQDVTLLSGGYTPKRSSIAGGGVRGKKALVVDVSMNQLFGTSWSRFGGPDPRADITILADALRTVEALVAELERREHNPAAQERRSALAERHDKQAAKVRANALHRRDDPVISLPRLTEEVYDAVAGKPWVLAVRNHRSWQDGLWQFTGSGEYLGGDGGGGIGYGPAAAAGAALALKGTGKFAVAILGDGEFLMAPGALWTAATHKVPLLIVILNNRTWGNDEFHQREIAEQRGRPVENAHIGQRMSDPDIDIATIAKGLGVWSTGPIREPAKLAAALDAAVSVVEKGGIALVEVVTALD